MISFFILKLRFNLIGIKRSTRALSQNLLTVYFFIITFLLRRPSTITWGPWSLYNLRLSVSLLDDVSITKFWFWRYFSFWIPFYAILRLHKISRNTYPVQYCRLLRLWWNLSVCCVWWNGSWSRSVLRENTRFKV